MYMLWDLIFLYKWTSTIRKIHVIKIKKKAEWNTSTLVFFFVKRCISSNFKFVILFHQQDSKDNKTVPKEQKQEKPDKNDAAEKYVVMKDCCIGFVLFNF